MGEIWFYHLERTGPEDALPPLLEKCLAKGWRALVRSGLPERLEALDAALWTYSDEAFLPHGREGPNAARQPVLLSAAIAPVNGAKAAFLLDGAPLQGLAPYERVSVLFDGRDEPALAHARAQWKEAKSSGGAVAYWKQTPKGEWTKAP